MNNCGCTAFAKEALWQYRIGFGLYLSLRLDVV
jgi:hypothetical protein